MMKNLVDDIKRYMSDKSICKSIKYYDIVNSTNILAKQLAEKGADEGTLIIADSQTAGKGRKGRTWYSDSGAGIYMSLILKPVLAPTKVSGLTLISALAVANAIKNLYDLSPQIKWPNDIVLGKKKICGILTEMSLEMDFIKYAVVGIGINVNTKSFSSDIAAKASSIILESGKAVDKAQLIAEIMVLFGAYYNEFIVAASFEPFIIQYNNLLANKDREVQILYDLAENIDKADIEYGTARGVNKEGALVVDTKNGLKNIVSGEVSVRGLYDYV